MEWMLYSKTWLQFVFPVYIQVLVGLVILISHSLLGSNPIPVLATLILLSYVKVLRTLIAANSFADLDYPGLNMRRVWLYDANIEYLVAKHIPLFLVALLSCSSFSLTLSCFFLVSGYRLDHILDSSHGSTVQDCMKPFMDSYHAPYKAKQHYWPGLLLVLRCVLLLVFAFNHQQNPNINLLAILAGTAILVVWA